MQKSLTKKLGMTVAAIAMAATGLFTATDAEAVPAFARQTGMTCTSCHFQSYPALNGMGRSFKSGGYTMQGTQPMIEGEGLSIPSALNMSVIWKYFWNSNADGYEIAAQDEVAFLVGGRVNASTGFLWEVINDGFASQKIHFNVTDNFAIVPFVTDGAGMAYGFELMNTAIERPIRPIENRRAFNAGHDWTQSLVGSASGIAFAYTDPSFFVTYTMYAPEDAGYTGAVLNGTKLGAWIRGAYFFDLAGFDTGVGVGLRSGSYDSTDALGAVTTVDLNATYIDFQMQGEVGGKPLGIYVTSATDSVNGSTSSGLVAKYTALEHFEVFFANSNGIDNDTDNTKIGRGSVGFEYLTSQNVKILVSSNSYENGSDATTQIGFEAAM